MDESDLILCNNYKTTVVVVIIIGKTILIIYNYLDVRLDDSHHLVVSLLHSLSVITLL